MATGIKAAVYGNWNVIIVIYIYFGTNIGHLVRVQLTYMVATVCQVLDKMALLIIHAAQPL